jgi:hypothetical protein
MVKDPNSFQKLAGVVDALTMDPTCGDRMGFHMCKWTLLVMWYLNTPCPQLEGLETSSPYLSQKMGIIGSINTHLTQTPSCVLEPSKNIDHMLEILVLLIALKLMLVNMVQALLCVCGRS